MGISAFPKKSKTQWVVDEVINLIVDGTFKVEEKLPPEAYFVESFNVSRVTVREAFKQLASMGIVDIRQGEGTFVRKTEPSDLVSTLLPLLIIDVNNMDELYDARICIETGILDLAVRLATDDDLKDLDRILDDMKASYKNETFDVYNQLDDQFHDKITNMSRNPILLSIYNMLHIVRQKSIKSSNISSESIRISLEKHGEIVEAIRRRDSACAVALMKEHLLFAKKQMLSHIAQPQASGKEL